MSWFPNGKIKEEGGLSDGKRNGKWRFYYESGNVFEEMSYRNGRPDGKKTTWYEHGVIMTKGEFKDGYRTGKWIQYGPKGQVLNEQVFKEGKPTGKKPKPSQSKP
jgi:antitoxin component YwqK of YwqJK toxin-antitoxin module